MAITCSKPCWLTRVVSDYCLFSCMQFVSLGCVLTSNTWCIFYSTCFSVLWENVGQIYADILSPYIKWYKIKSSNFFFFNKDNLFIYLILTCSVDFNHVIDTNTRNHSKSAYKIFFRRYADYTWLVFLCHCKDKANDD